MTSPKAETPAADQRFKPIPLENLTQEQRVLADAIRSGPRGAVKNSAAAKPGPLGGPFNVWLRSPGIGNIVQSLGAEIRFRSSLPSKLNELAILVTARHWTSQYEWLAHHRLALEAVHEHPVQDGCRRPMRWATSLLRADCPRVPALHALAPPRPKPPNPSATTGGFRMFGVHACELPQIPPYCPTGNPPSKSLASTEFLYPSPNCDLNR